MSRRGTPGKARPRSLSQEDEALWDAVSQAYEPLKRNKPRVLGREVVAAAGDGAPPQTGDQTGETKPGERGRPTVPRPTGRAAPATPRPPAPRPPPLAEFDRRKAKKLAAGRESIDARIDLHGMRQSEAHAALRSFLLSCYADGRRNVLVITGKGGPAMEDETAPSSFMDSKTRGVLKRNVPMWLAEPELRAIVVSFHNAARPHGGSGALYVHLRARRRAGGGD